MVLFTCKKERYTKSTLNAVCIITLRFSLWICVTVYCIYIKGAFYFFKAVIWEIQ